MPVIRGRQSVTKIPDDRKKALLNRLVAEREGKGIPAGPVIFEIPLDEADKVDVMVVWDEWAGIRSEDRTDIIREAYQEKADSISLALGLTRQEAIEQGTLPYRVRLMFGPQPDFTESELADAALALGGFPRPDGVVDLRFPTQSTAEEAAQQLGSRLPGSKWVVNFADVGSIPSGS